MKKFVLIGTVILMTIYGATFASAQDWQPVNAKPAPNLNIIKSYKNLVAIPKLTIPVPGIVEVDFLPSEVYSDLVAVHNEDTKSFVSYRVVNSNNRNVVVKDSVDRVSLQSLQNLFDYNYDSVVDFRIDNPNVLGSAYLEITFSEPIKSTSLNISLSEYVSLPRLIKVSAIVDDKEVIVLNGISPNSSIINFPETTSTEWRVELKYSQPLRISELSFNNLLNTSQSKTVRFLGIPNNSYVIYVNPENSFRDEANSQNNVSAVDGNASFKKLGKFNVVENPSFVLSDRDSDGVPDVRDNCVHVSNLDQTDLDQNGRGDTCDDFDSDTILNNQDNCPTSINPNQLDTDGDGVGDLCDTEESRLTEKYPIIVWFGIGFAVLVLLTLLFIVINKVRNNNQIPPSPPAPPNTPEL